MFETPEALYARAADSLRMPPVQEWEEFPFDGDAPARARASGGTRGAATGRGRRRLLDVRTAGRGVPLDERTMAPHARSTERPAARRPAAPARPLRRAG